MASIPYRNEIDGLRAVAIVPVILFHMDRTWMPGGFLGVDVFFVISGFLITSIAKKELEDGTFSFRNFWLRRIRRILPALICMTATMIAVACAFIFRPLRVVVMQQALTALFSVANIYFWKTDGDYWGPDAESSPFLHCWSLSVEEQFYLILPVALWFLFRFQPAKIRGFFLAIFVTSLALFLYGATADPTATFYLLPTRAWELAAGSLLATTLPATSLNRQPNRRHLVLAFLGLSLVLGSFLTMREIGAGVLMPVLGTSLIIAFGHAGACQAILSRPLMVRVGQLSYSLYLWHWPVLTLTRTTPIAGNRLLILSIIYGLALASYHFVEKPSRHSKKLIPTIAGCYAITAAVAFAVLWSGPLYDTSEFNQARWVPYNCHPEFRPDQSMYRHVQLRLGTTEVDNHLHTSTAYEQDGILVGDANRVPRIVVLGDSHGCMWSHAIAESAKDLSVTASFYCMDGVPPFLQFPVSRQQQGLNQLSSDQKYRFDMARIGSIDKWKPDVVIIAARWSPMSVREAAPTLDFLRDRCSKVLLIEDPPRLTTSVINVQQWLCFQGDHPRVGEKVYRPCLLETETQGGRGAIRELARRYSNVDIVPTYDIYLRANEALVRDGKDVLYLNDDHLLDAGAAFASPIIRSAIADALREVSARPPAPEKVSQFTMEAVE